MENIFQSFKKRTAVRDRNIFIYSFTRKRCIRLPIGKSITYIWITSYLTCMDLQKNFGHVRALFYWKSDRNAWSNRKSSSKIWFFCDCTKTTRTSTNYVQCTPEFQLLIVIVESSKLSKTITVLSSLIKNVRKHEN